MTKPLSQSNNQGTFKKLFLSNDYGMALDYFAGVFLSMFSSTPKKNMEMVDDQIVYKKTGKVPSVVHYNGMRLAVAMPMLLTPAMQSPQAGRPARRTGCKGFVIET